MTELVNGKDVLASLFLLCQLDDLECVFCSGSLDSFWHLWLSAPIWMSAQPHKKKKSPFIEPMWIPFQGQMFLIWDSHPPWHKAYLVADFHTLQYCKSLKVVFLWIPWYFTLCCCFCLPLHLLRGQAYI